MSLGQAASTGLLRLSDARACLQRRGVGPPPGGLPQRTKEPETPWGSTWEGGRTLEWSPSAPAMGAQGTKPSAVGQGVWGGCVAWCGHLDRGPGEDTWALLSLARSPATGVVEGEGRAVGHSGEARFCFVTNSPACGLFSLPGHLRPGWRAATAPPAGAAGLAEEPESKGSPSPAQTWMPLWLMARTGPGAPLGCEAAPRPVLPHAWTLGGVCRKWGPGQQWTTGS